MKKALGFLLCLTSIFPTAAQVDIPGSAQAVAAEESSGYVITDRGPHHRVWSRVTWLTNGLGEVIGQTNSFTELETGLHFWRDGHWLETKAQIELLPDGAAATNGPHQVIFAANLNTVGAVDLTTADGLRLRSRVFGLSYFDASTGKAVLLAETKDSIGLLVGDNQI